MKRFIALLSVLVFVFAFTACDEKDVDKVIKNIAAETEKIVSENVNNNTEKTKKKKKSKKDDGNTDAKKTSSVVENKDNSANDNKTVTTEANSTTKKNSNGTVGAKSGNETQNAASKKSVTTTTSVGEWDYDDYDYYDDYYDDNSYTWEDYIEEKYGDESKTNKHEHSLSVNVVPPTCGNPGYTEHECACGYGYITEEKLPTGNHDFENMGNVYFKCKNCDKKVIAYGNADGSLGNKSSVKYYVTSPDCVSYTENDDCTVVIYGSGDMPNFSKTNLPPWYDFLLHTSKIRIENGITSIGTYCFYQPNIRGKVTFSIGDSVKIIKRNAINIPMNEFVAGMGVERIENGIFGTDTMYWPVSLKYYGNDFFDTKIHYAGTRAEFLSVTMPYYSQNVTVKTRFEKYYANDVYSWYNHTWLNADSINDNSDYFDTYKEFKK